jgi:hypothetical protein
MRTDSPVRCRFEDELRSLIAGQQFIDADGARPVLFEALLNLESRARRGGASTVTLRKIAEARFLVGILRDAVRPVRAAPLRTLLRVQASAQLDA